MYWGLGMFQNYFKLTLRNIRKHKLHSLINILSLSLGLTVFLFISAFILNEVRHDSFHKNLDRDRAYILNESAVKQFGMKQPIGEVINNHTVIGVVKDFHFRSFHHPIGPLFLVYESDNNPIINVGISGNSLEMAIDGIRKVLGASLGGVLLLLIRDFLKWVLVAIVIAWPVAWLGMNRWLQHFAYRIRLEIWVFLVSGLITFVIALVTVCLKGIKTSRADPIDSLRNE